MGHLSITCVVLAFALAVGGGFLLLAVHAIFGEIMKRHKVLVLSNFAAGFGAVGTLSPVLRLL